MITVGRVRADDPRVVPVIETHVATMDALTPDPDACHRLDLSGLLADHITFFAAFDGEEVVGIGAYAHCPAVGDAPGEVWGEVKSMHVLAAHRGRGIATLVLDTIEATARRHGAQVLRLETSVDFDAAIGLYTRAGFVPRGPFGDYPDHPLSRFFEKQL